MRQQKASGQKIRGYMLCKMRQKKKRKKKFDEQHLKNNNNRAEVIKYS